jgi:hypothetical protein
MRPVRSRDDKVPLILTVQVDHMAHTVGLSMRASGLRR